jgi:hypothetical protein
MLRKVKDGRQRSSIVGKFRAFVSQLIKKRMRAPFQWFQSPRGCIRERPRDEIHGLIRRLVSENLSPLTALDLRKFELNVVGIHGSYLFFGGRSKHLDDFHQLVDPRVSREKGLAEQEFRTHTSLGPNVNGRRVIRGTKNQLGGPVVARADVGNVGFSLDERLGGTKVTEFELLIFGVDQQVLRFDIAMANAQLMDVCQRSGQLIQIELDKDKGERDVVLVMPPTYRVHSLWDEL